MEDKDKHDWQRLPDLPTPEELMTDDEPEVLNKPLVSPAATKAEYLSNQYKLCRVEATQLVRRAIRLFRDDSDILDNNDFAVYTQVRVFTHILNLPFTD